MKCIPESAPQFCAVVARAKNGTIGRDGDLPWRLSSDLKHFKRLTVGRPCLMGRKTWESLPGVLPGRPHLVLTRDQDYQAEGAEVFHDLREMAARGAEIAGLTGQSQVMVIGGAEIYRLMLPHLDRIYETIVEADVDGDAQFPALDMRLWRVTDHKAHTAGPRDDHDFTTRTLDRL